MARDRTSRGTRRRRDPYKRIARSRNSTRRAYRASTPLATKGQLQRPVLVSTSAREAVPRASFQAREGLAVLVAEGGSTFAAVEVSNSCIATAPRRRRNKPKTSHGAGRLRHPIDTGRRRESCRDIKENEGEAQNDTKEEARNPTKGQNYTRSPDPPRPGGRRALGGLDVAATAGGTSTTADDGRQDAILDVSAPYKRSSG